MSWLDALSVRWVTQGVEIHPDREKVSRRCRVQADAKEEYNHQQDRDHGFVSSRGYGRLGWCRGIVERRYLLKPGMWRCNLGPAICAKGRVLLKGCSTIRTIRLSYRQFQAPGMLELRKILPGF